MLNLNDVQSVEGEMITPEEEVNLCIDYLKKHPDEAQILIDCLDDCIGIVSNMIRNSSGNKEEIYNKGE